MSTTRLSTKGQVVIPGELRARFGWKPGLELEVLEVGNGIVIRPAVDVPVTTLAELRTVVQYDGPPLSLQDMDAAIVRLAGEPR